MNRPNMDYCKFENTLAALRQCYNSFDEKLDKHDSEYESRKSLYKLCAGVVCEFDEEEFESEE